MKRVRVFLADDHAVVRDGLKMLVNAEHDMEVCGEASDGAETCARVRQCEPDVVVLDVSMPAMSGTEVARRLHQEMPETRLLALTVHEDQGYLQQFLQAGAVGYVLKRTAAEDLIQAIRTVAAGGVHLDPRMAAKIAHTFTRSREGRQKQLTHREDQVARLVAQGYSNKEVAAELDISVKTVETHKSRLMEKLGLSTRAEVIRHAITHGWLSDV